MRELRAGSVIDDRWRIDGVIGRGGMGIVYAARSVRSGRRVALKVMCVPGVGCPKHIRRFAREIRAMRRLKSAHVARIHSVADSGRQFYMVMELLEGETLHARVRREKVSIEEAVSWIREACEGVAHAHEHGIVHRDIKLSNLFLARRGDESPVVKVLDFGIAKMTDDETRDLTGSATVLGTPLFMSPEQFDDSRNVDARTDVWALGACLYRLLCGVHPFQAPTAIQVLAKLRTESPPRPSEYRAEITPELEDLIMRCLSRRPDDRPKDARELADALASALAPPPIDGFAGVIITSVLAAPVAPHDAPAMDRTQAMPRPIAVTPSWSLRVQDDPSPPRHGVSLVAPASPYLDALAATLAMTLAVVATIALRAIHW